MQVIQSALATPVIQQPAQNKLQTLVFGQEKKASVFRRPSPKKYIMSFLSLLNNGYLKGIPILRSLPLLNQFPLMGGRFKVNKIDIPKADRALLRETMDSKNAVFTTPNHPEFMTDWLLDKYLSTHFSPKMATWAAAAIVNSPNKMVKNFWLNNNIIANNGGREAVEYSIEQAIKGNGVLLHPEGTVRWNGNYIHQLLPGAVDMSIKTAEKVIDEGLERPVFLNPVLWKLHLNRDASKALTEEMALIEEKLNLPIGQSNDPLLERFMTLQENVLHQQMDLLMPEKNFRKELAEVKEGVDSYFEQADEFFAILYADLEKRYVIKQGGVLDRRVHRFQKAITETYKKEKIEATLNETSKARLKVDRARVIELKRLRCFTKELYGEGIYGDKGLTQEEMAESLKLIRQVLIDDNNYDKFNGLFPKPLGWRTAHIRAVGPIDMIERVKKAREDRQSMEALSQQILVELRDSMQRCLDALNLEIEPELAKYRIQKVEIAG